MDAVVVVQRVDELEEPLLADIIRECVLDRFEAAGLRRPFLVPHIDLACRVFAGYNDGETGDDSVFLQQRSRIVHYLGR